MLFRRIEDPKSCSISYLLADPDEQEAALIDPRAEQADLLLAILTEHRLHLRYVLRTHFHSAEEADCGRLCLHRGTSLVLGNDAPMTGRLPSRIQRVSDGDILVLGFEVIRVLATPGHTSGCVSYLWRDRLFCGDALEIRGCPPVDSRNAGRLWDSVTGTLFALPDETLVFPAHDFNGRSVSTIGEERRYNPAFSSVGRDAFLTMARDHDGPRPTLAAPPRESASPGQRAENP